ncbi:NLR family CARD domain-containing protein 4-like [Macrobrachium rosenbergii]|uniref:NLR family CARD domain-containing protein 4-like n=1 Tax=Macrobrachium rosenbergii TaxID=79674 RepID=UPI0034D6D6EF
MNKICQALWEKKVNDPGAELRGLVKKIKDERNVVSHESPDLSDTDFERKLRDFQAILEETLEKIKSLFPAHSADTDQLKAEIQDAVPKLLEKIREKYDPSNPQDVQRLKEEIEEFGSELSDMIQESSERKLRSLYERLCQILPYDWLAQYGATDPGNIMVCLQVEDDQELNRGPHGNKGIIVNQKEILTKDKMGKDPEAVIISGDAGSGKTTILCSYAEGWCKKTMDIPELSSFKFLLYMQFRNHDHDNFDDYLKSLIPETAAKFPFDLVKSVVLGSKSLVLCDGFDEANNNSRKLFQELLELNSNNIKFVVTTRPGNAEELTDIVNKGKRSRINLKVSGLQEEDMKLLTENLIGYLLKDDVTQQEQMKKELLQKIEEMNTDTGAILQTPLYFNLFILLYIECPDLRDEMSTRSSVYLQLRKHKIKRISNKTGTSVKSLEEFDALYRKWSLKHYTEEKYEWSEADVESFKKEIHRQQVPVLQNFDAIMSSYFSIKKTVKHLEVVNVYCHRHRSEQEFAVAGSICDDIVTSSGRPHGGNVIRDVLQLKGLWDGKDHFQLFMKFREVISFIPGILYGTDRGVLHDTIQHIHEIYVSYISLFMFMMAMMLFWNHVAKLD